MFISNCQPKAFISEAQKLDRILIIRSIIKSRQLEKNHYIKSWLITWLILTFNSSYTRSIIFSSHVFSICHYCWNNLPKKSLVVGVDCKGKKKKVEVLDSHVYTMRQTYNFEHSRGRIQGQKDRDRVNIYIYII